MSAIGSNVPRPAMANPASAAQMAAGVLTDANRRLETPGQWEELGALLASLRPLAAQTGSTFPMEPVPFTWNGDIAGLPNAAGQIQPGCCGNLRGQAALEDMLRQMDALIARLEPRGAASPGTGAAGTSAAGSATGPASSGGGVPISDSSGWGSIDTMMAQAEKLAMSDKPSDQLKAQKLMMQARQMFETVSKLLQQMAEMAKTAISNIR
ncbi:MAG: hypothetical protein R2762_28950 [Bryobacteraceae bacterium]